MFPFDNPIKSLLPFLFVCSFCFVSTFSFQGLKKITLTHCFIRTACNCPYRFSPLVPLLTSSAFNRHRQYCTWVRNFRTICWWAWFSQTGQRKMQKTIHCWSKFLMQVSSHYSAILLWNNFTILRKHFPLKIQPSAIGRTVLVLYWPERAKTYHKAITGHTLCWVCTESQILSSLHFYFLHSLLPSFFAFLASFFSFAGHLVGFIFMGKVFRKVSRI